MEKEGRQEGGGGIRGILSHLLYIGCDVRVLHYIVDLSA